MKSAQTTRRQLLKGIALGSGGLVLSPLVSQLAAQAAGKDAFPQRFVFVVKSSGLTPGHIVPNTFIEDYISHEKSYIAGEGYTSGLQMKENDTFISRSLMDAKLEGSMKSLEPFKDRLTILQGLSGNMVTAGCIDLSKPFAVPDITQRVPGICNGQPAIRWVQSNTHSRREQAVLGHYQSDIVVEVTQSLGWATDIRSGEILLEFRVQPVDR